MPLQPCETLQKLLHIYGVVNVPKNIAFLSFAESGLSCVSPKYRAAKISGMPTPESSPELFKYFFQNCEPSR